ncbi:unnamed protein product [Caenorhabditis angaria]|uniref:Uncharacterized protein n=1 Tax=Caenorhabditis angaria TaxID=860376 RepID=A0A9P1N7L8_9PELO|nr:unnamed protein product [Caenorhabditis angaria]
MEIFGHFIKKRQIGGWCENGYPYPAMCPGPSDPEYLKYCCTFFGQPSCCQYPIHDGILIGSCFACIVLFILFIGLYCWCWPGSRLNRRRMRMKFPQNVAADENFHQRRNSYKSSINF